MKIGIIVAKGNGLKTKKNVFVYETINSFLNLFIEYQGDKQFYYINKYNKNNTDFNNVINFKIGDNVTLEEIRTRTLLLQQKYQLDKLVVYQDNFTNLIKAEGAKKLFDKCYNKKINYVSNKIRIQLLYFIYLLTTQLKIPIIHIIEDPLEINYKYFNSDNKQFCFYTNNRFNLTTLFELHRFKIFENKKEFIFTFGFTNMIKNKKFRQNIYKFFNDKIKHISFKFNIFYNHGKTLIGYNNLQECNYVSYHQYLEYVSKSYYTFIIPSYDENEFSMLRFLESVINKCIPIIVHNTDVDKFFNDKLDILYVLKSHNLIYNNIDQAFNSINISKYDIIMNDLLNCQSIKNIILNINNKSKINEQINRILN